MWRALREEAYQELVQLCAMPVCSRDEKLGVERGNRANVNTLIIPARVGCTCYCVGLLRRQEGSAESGIWQLPQRDI